MFTQFSTITIMTKQKVVLQKLTINNDHINIAFIIKRRIFKKVNMYMQRT